jgi:hypothetical protein
MRVGRDLDAEEDALDAARTQPPQAQMARPRVAQASPSSSSHGAIAIGPDGQLHHVQIAALDTPRSVQAPSTA